MINSGGEVITIQAYLKQVLEGKIRNEGEAQIANCPRSIVGLFDNFRVKRATDVRSSAESIKKSCKTHLTLIKLMP